MHRNTLNPAMKYLLFFSCLTFSLVASAQGQYRMVLGGSLGFNHRSADGFRTETRQEQSPVFPFDFFTVVETVPVEEQTIAGSFSPYLGKMLSEKVMLGVGLDMRFSSNRVERAGGTSESVNNSHTLGGYFWMRYTLNPANRVRLYLEPRLGYAHSDGVALLFVSSSVFSSGTTHTVYLNTPLGLMYALSERFLLNVRTGSFNVTHRNWERSLIPDNGSSLDVGLNLSLRSFSFGVDYLF